MHSEPIYGSRIWAIYDFFTPKECDTQIAFSEGKGAPVTARRKYVIRTDVMYRIKRGNRPQSSNEETEKD